jgi:hypothetical protein
MASAAVAILVQQLEARRVRAAEVEHEIRLLKIIGQFVFEVRAKLRDIDQHDIPYLKRNWTALDAPVACLRATPFDAYPVESVAFSVATALLSYQFMRDASEQLGSSVGSADQAAHIDKSRQHALAGFFRAENEIEAALIRRGSKLPRMQIDFETGVSIRTLEPDPL